MDLKKAAAEKAGEFVKDKMSIGLGAGSTMAFMVVLLEEKIQSGLVVKLYSSSFATTQLLLQKNITVHDIGNVATLDIYFDGCDQLDKHLNALKSGGGIHTREKLFASMASQFILVGDDGKYAETLDHKYAVVIELIPEALHYITASIQRIFADAKPVLRMGDKKDGAILTERGNFLIDIWFNELPAIATINPLLKSITGVVETSLFYGLAHTAILAGNNGVKIIHRPL